MIRKSVWRVLLALAATVLLAHGALAKSHTKEPVDPALEREQKASVAKQSPKIAEEKVEVAEEKAKVAEERVKVAEEKAKVAEEKLKVAEEKLKVYETVADIGEDGNAAANKLTETD